MAEFITHASFVIALVAFQALAVAVGSNFLQPGNKVAPDPFQQVAILYQLEEVAGWEQRQATEARLEDITQMLSATFATLPKNARGAVGTSAARYALHRLFLQRHGWHIKRIAPTGDSRASSSPALALGDRMSGQVRDLFEERLGSRDFDLHELAVLAASIENLIHGEAVGRHASNTVVPALFKMWEDVKGTSALLFDEEAVAYAQQMAVFSTSGRSEHLIRQEQIDDSGDERALCSAAMWSPEEELVEAGSGNATTTAQEFEIPSTSREVLRSVVLLAGSLNKLASLLRDLLKVLNGAGSNSPAIRSEQITAKPAHSLYV